MHTTTSPQLSLIYGIIKRFIGGRKGIRECYGNKKRNQCKTCVFSYLIKSLKKAKDILFIECHYEMGLCAHMIMFGTLSLLFAYQKKQGWIHGYPSRVRVGSSSAGEGN